MDQTDTSTFNWVKARADCSPVAVFVALKPLIETDVDQRRALLTDAERDRCLLSFNPGSGGSRSFTVTVVGFGHRGEHVYDDEIAFKPTAAGISVSGKEGKVFLEGSLTLSIEGECKLKVGNDELNFWQFRKKALEGILFEGVRMALYGTH